MQFQGKINDGCDVSSAIHSNQLIWFLFYWRNIFGGQHEHCAAGVGPRTREKKREKVRKRRKIEEPDKNKPQQQY